MAWALVGSAAIGLGGAYMASKGADKAAGQQYEGTLAGIESEERMFDKSLALMEAYRESGYNALEGSNQLIDPAGREELLGNYYESGEFQHLQQQSEEQQMRNALATGGARGGRNYLAMEQIAPELGYNYLANRENQLTGMANMGMGAASQGSSQANQMGGRLSALQQSGADARAQNSLAQANIWGNAVTDIGGMGLDYLRGKG